MRKNIYRCASCLAAYLWVALGAIAFTGCASDDDGGGGFPASGTRLKLQNLDIADAKYLSLIDNSSESRASDETQPALFKIDAEGNLSAVALTCTEEEDGSIKWERTDLRVIPRSVHSLAGTYTFLYDRKFIDEQGQSYSIRSYYEPDSDSWIRCHLLVRNADGRIFYVPSAAHRYFNDLDIYEDLYRCELNAAGNLYMYCFDHSASSLISVSAKDNGEVEIRQLNPESYWFDMSRLGFYVLDNGTVIVPSLSDTTPYSVVFYPNGG